MGAAELLDVVFSSWGMFEEGYAESGELGVGEVLRFLREEKREGTVDG